MVGTDVPSIGVAFARVAYVALLPPPGSMSTPFHWSEADLSALATYYPALGRRVEKQKKTWCVRHIDQLRHSHDTLSLSCVVLVVVGRICMWGWARRGR